MNISDSIKKFGGNIEKPVLDKSGTAKGNDKTGNKEGAVNTGNTAPPSTSVQLSTGSSEIYDAGKVEEIKAAIERGDFSVDTGKVADGLLQTVKDLIQPKQ